MITLSGTVTREMPIACIAGKNSAIVEKLVSIRSAPSSTAWRMGWGPTRSGLAGRGARSSVRVPSTMSSAAAASLTIAPASEGLFAPPVLLATSSAATAKPASTTALPAATAQARASGDVLRDSVTSWSASSVGETAAPAASGSTSPRSDSIPLPSALPPRPWAVETRSSVLAVPTGHRPCVWAMARILVTGGDRPAAHGGDSAARASSGSA